jgi:hypothetical protein
VYRERGANFANPLARHSAARGWIRYYKYPAAQRAPRPFFLMCNIPSCTRSSFLAALFLR